MDLLRSPSTAKLTSQAMKALSPSAITSPMEKRGSAKLWNIVSYTSRIARSPRICWNGSLNVTTSWYTVSPCAKVVVDKSPNQARWRQDCIHGCSPDQMK
ncbi:hypothetical protein OL229_09860 [Neisseriaceae bacterium JH1-16]|nr:hypothetical protein [Neisseriaceae bacterium JH1-16]